MKQIYSPVTSRDLGIPASRGHSAFEGMGKSDIILRRAAVVELWGGGRRSKAEIQRLSGEGYPFITRTLDRYKETGGVEDRPRGGRPRTDISSSDIRRITSKETGSTRRLARALRVEGGVKASKETIRMRAHELGLRSRVRPRKPRLTTANRQVRLAFAYVARPRNYWERVVAVDEKTIPLYSDTRQEWVEEGEEPSPRETVKWPGGLKVWAGTSWKGKTKLHFIPRNMTGPDYAEFLRAKAMPDMLTLYPHKARPPILLQDREGFHTAEVVLDFIRNSPLQLVSPYPSHSPDLNWQENAWEMLMQGVRERNPTTFEGLRRVMEEEWEKIPLAHIRKCIGSMPRRLKEVIALGGGMTNY
jgi:transposase